MRPLLAELFGTFVLVFVVAGATTLKSGAVLGAAVAYGAALAAVMSTMGGASGAHVNPAFTFGMAVTGRIAWPRAAAYVAAQVAGAILGALALGIALGDRAGSLGATRLAEDVGAFQGLFTEAVLTAVLVFAAASPGKGVAAGLVAAAGVLVAQGITGASMNPARTLGPGIVSGTLGDLWIYLAGPCAGGASGALLARWLGPPGPPQS